MSGYSQGYGFDPAGGNTGYITACDGTITGDITVPSTLVNYSGNTITITGIMGAEFTNSSAIPANKGSPFKYNGYGGPSYPRLNVTSIILPPTLRNLYTHALADCASLRSITIPSGITKIPTYCFYNCTALTTLTIPSTVTTIDERAFEKCSALDNIIIPEGVTSIGSYAFQSCTNLSSVTFPASLLSISFQAFDSNPKLLAVSIYSITTLSGQPFRSPPYGPTVVTVLPTPFRIESFNNQVYTGNSIVPTFPNQPTDGGISFTISPTPVKNAGTYTVRAVGSTLYNYTLPATDTFQITQVPFGTVILNNVTYTGSTVDTTIQNYPVGETLSFTYDRPPITVGTYTVSAITSQNYIYVLSKPPPTFQIEKATFNITSFTDIVYGGSKKPTFANNPNDTNLTIITSKPVANVGTYTVTSVTSDNYIYTLPNTATFQVTPVDFTITSFDNLTYNGSTQVVTFFPSPGDTNLVITTTPSVVQTVGTYTVKNVTSDNYTYTLSAPTFQMLPLAYSTTLVLDNTSVPYDGDAHFATINASIPGPGEIITLSYYDPFTKDQVFRPTAIGFYNIAATSQNYTYTFSPTQLQITRPFWSAPLVLSKAWQEYNEKPQDPIVDSAFLSSLPAGERSIQFTYNDAIGKPLQNSPTLVGSYTITSASSTNYNFNLPTPPTFSISLGNYGTPLILSGQEKQYSYNVVQGVTATNAPPGETVVFTYSQNGMAVSPINVGRYIVLTATSANYKYALPFDAMLIINPAPYALGLSSATPQYNNATQNTTATNKPANETTISFSYSQGGVTVQPINAGTYTVSAATSGSGLYTYSLNNNQFTIAKQTGATLGITTTTFAFSGLAPTLAAMGLTNMPVGETPVLTYSAPPISVGTYTITGATSANYIYAISGTITITPQQYSYNITTPQNSYTGSALGVSISYENPNYTGTVYYAGVNVTYASSTIPPANVGTYVVNIVSPSPNYTLVAQGSSIYIITPTAVSITFVTGTLVQTYNPSGTTVQFTKSPNVANHIVYYDNQTNIPIDVGTYGVSVVISDPNNNYIGSKSGTLTIKPQWVTITLGNLNPTYTGQPLSVSATPNFPQPIIVLYNGLTTPPTDAGSYTVYAFVDQTTTNNYVGNITATLVIAKQIVPITLYNLTQAYTGKGVTPSALTMPANLDVVYTFGGSSIAPISVGSYSIVGTINDTNYTGTATSVMQITVATAYVTLLNLTQAYTGEPIRAGVITYPYGISTILSYDGSSNPPTNPGIYMVGGVINDTNYTGFSYNTLTIPHLPATVQLSSIVQTFTGSPLSTTVVTNPGNLSAIFLYNGLAMPPSSVGSYNVTATINDSFYEGSTASTFTITKALADIQFTNTASVYSGSYISTTAITNPAGLNVSYTYDGSNTMPLNTGIYTVTATVNDKTYMGSLTSPFVVQMASTPIKFLAATATYTGAPQNAYAIASPSNIYIGYEYYNYDSLSKTIPAPSNAGTYTVKASALFDANYGGSVYSTFTIQKGVGAVKFSSNVFIVPYGKPQSIVGTTSPFKSLNVQYNYSSMQYNSSNFPTDIGTYMLYGTITNENNWTGYGSTIVTIVQGGAAIAFPSTSVSYTAHPLPVDIVTTPPGLTTNVTYNGYSAAPINIGVYNVQATINDPRWKGSATLSNYTITRGVPVIQISSMSILYSVPYSLSTFIFPNTLTPSYSYSNANYNSVIPPTNAGTYTVSGTVSTSLYYGVGTSQLVIQPYPEPVYIAGLTQIYTGGPVTPYAVTDTPNILTNYEYATIVPISLLPDSVNPADLVAVAGGATAPKSFCDASVPTAIIQQPSFIGKYIVKAKLADPNYVGESCAYFSVKIGPPITLNSYAVNEGAVLVWTPPASSSPLAYIITTIPPDVSAFSTTDTFALVSGLQNGKPYIFSVTPSVLEAADSGLPYQATISPYIGTGEPAYIDDEESLAAMNTPSDIAFDSAGNMYIADTLNGCVRKMDGSGAVTTYASNCGKPQGLAIDVENNIYVSDAQNHVIYKLTGPTTSPTIFAGTFGSRGLFNANGTSAQFNTPKGLAVYMQGSIFTLLVADSANHLIRIVDVSANVNTLAGTGIAGYINAQGHNAGFNTPTGVAVDSLGNIYVADKGNNRIRMIDATLARNVTTFSGSEAGFMDGTTTAKFSAPSRIVISALNDLYIADTGNNCIRAVSPSGLVTTPVGYTKAGNTNGLGTGATLSAPQGLAFDTNMNLYVADSANHMIRRITFNPLTRAIPNASASYIPFAPQNLSAIENSENIILTWTPAIQPILPLSGYRLNYNGMDYPIDRTATTATMSGLISNTTYTFTLYAKNVFGESVGVSVTATTTATNVGFLFGGTSQYYTGQPLSIQVSTVPPALPVSLSYTSNGVPILAPIEIGTYSGIAQVSSEIYVGSAKFSLTIVDPSPYSVTNISAVALNGSAAVSWLAPVNTGNGNLTNFTVTTTPTDTPPITTVNNFTSSIVVSGLQNATLYTFAVVANNFYGSSAPLTVSAMPRGPATTPLNVVAARTAQGSLEIRWDPPINTGGYPITSYIIEPVTPNQTTASARSNGSPYVFQSGLRGGFPYVFIVKAVNQAGVGAASIASAQEVPYTVPEKPTVTAIRGYQKATVSWSIPSNGGLPITSFVVLTNPATTSYTTKDGATTQYEVYGLNDSVTYSFSVYGINSLGNGDIGISPFMVGKPVAPQRSNRPSWFS